MKNEDTPARMQVVTNNPIYITWGAPPASPGTLIELPAAEAQRMLLSGHVRLPTDPAPARVAGAFVIKGVAEQKIVDRQRALQRALPPVSAASLVIAPTTVQPAVLSVMPPQVLEA